jgi:hypothetical protein
MIYSQILVGLLLIACGFLVKKYPNLIAGYNTMSQAEKDKINIKALALFLKQLLVGLGLFTIINYFLLHLLNIEELLVLKINTIAIIVGVIIGLIYANTNKKFKN